MIGLKLVAANKTDGWGGGVAASITTHMLTYIRTIMVNPYVVYEV